jgi:hypothetical protein
VVLYLEASVKLNWAAVMSVQVQRYSKNDHTLVIVTTGGLATTES